MTIPTVELPGGERVPALGQGTWQMERDDRRDCIRALRRGVELGLTLIDTAELYGSGRVEELVGEALDGLRDDVFLVTKVLPKNASRRGTVEALEQSLDRLGTDHVDLYLLHWKGSHPIQETMDAFRELLDEGLTRHVGVSNLSLQAFDEAQKALGEDHRLATDQVLYWLGARNVENELLPGLRDRDVPLMAYSPLGSGSLAEGEQQEAALTEVAQRHDVTVHQVALAWVLRHDDVLTIPKTCSVEHLEENLGATRFSLDQRDLERLDEAFPKGSSARLQLL